jgi:hypothetical protein
MKRMFLLFSAAILVISACSVEFNPPPLSLTSSAPQASNTPTVLMATPTFTTIPPSATSVPPTSVPPTATVIPPTATTANLVLTVDQLRNATFNLMGSDQIVRSISLKDGKFQQGTDPAVPGYISVTLGDKIAFGDLNGDGVEDAVISIAENYGGSGVFVSVVAILNQNGQPNAVGSALIDDRPVVNELSIKAGEIFLNATVHGPGDPMCCAARPSKRFYRLVENALVLSQLSTTTPDGSERTIQIDAPTAGSEVSGPFVINGSVSISPFENTLGYKVYVQGNKEPVEGTGFVIKADGAGGPGTFELPLDLSSLNLKGPVWVEIADTSPADGTYQAERTVFLVLK